MVLAGVHAEACYVQDNEGQHASVEEPCDSRLQQCKTLNWCQVEYILGCKAIDDGNCAHASSHFARTSRKLETIFDLSANAEYPRDNTSQLAVVNVALPVNARW